jgi:hypothetical protein
MSDNSTHKMPKLNDLAMILAILFEHYTENGIMTQPQRGRGILCPTCTDSRQCSSSKLWIPRTGNKMAGEEHLPLAWGNLTGYLP